MVTMESEAMISSKVEKVVARLSDPAGGEPPTADVSSGCQDPLESISELGWYSPMHSEKILLGSRRTTVLDRVNASQKKVMQLSMLRSRVTIWQKAGLFIPRHVAFLLQENMTSVV